MKLVNRRKSSFSLDIVGYQYPDIEDQYWDSNWLFIQIQIQVSDQSKSVIDACLTTFEIQLLHDWLKRFVVNGNKDEELGFTEPTIRFKIKNGRENNKKLQVIYRSSPNDSCGQTNQKISMQFLLEQVSLSEIVENLQNQLDRFPQRVFRDQFRITIEELTTDEAVNSQGKLKEGLAHLPNVKKVSVIWDSDRGVLVVGIVHDFSRQTTREATREMVRAYAFSVLSFSKSVYLDISD